VRLQLRVRIRDVQERHAPQRLGTGGRLLGAGGEAGERDRCNEQAGTASWNHSCLRECPRRTRRRARKVPALQPKRVGLTERTSVVRKVWNGRANLLELEVHGSAGHVEGLSLLVRFVISDITPDSAHFEQAFSDDGGKTWETNWIATDTRVKEGPDKAR
jgi:hypothetical protein